VKNVHFPQPHPNGGFSDSLLKEGIVLLAFIAVLVIELCEVNSSPSVEPACDIHISSCIALLVLTPL